MNKKNTPRLQQIILIQVLIFAALIIIAEFLLWSFFPSSLYGNSQIVTQKLPGLKNTIIYESRKFGLRSLSRIDNDKPENTIRILCFGASTTNQPTQETRDTWCGILEILLKHRIKSEHINIQTMAFGVGGFRAAHNAYWLQETFDKIKPDIVITMLGINDLAWNGGQNYQYRNIDEKLRSIKKQQAGVIKKKCLQYSQICRRFYHLKRKIKVKEQIEDNKVVEWHSANLPELRKKYREYPLITSPSRQPDPIIEFRDATQWIVNFLQKRDVNLIMLGQPVLWKPSMSEEEYNSLWFYINTPLGPVRAPGAWLENEMARFNNIQKNIAEKHAIKFLNLDNAIPKNMQYYFDDCHYTDHGSKTVADFVLPELLKEVEQISKRLNRLNSSKKDNYLNDMDKNI
jgi:lysophospholipase L1-like esterase